jgi:dimethylhistidine N-methyltransferase
VVEFGSGASVKIRILLSRLAPPAYVPIDISGDFLRESAEAIAAAFPATRVIPFEADFTRPLELPGEVARRPKLGFFPGSTIGNLAPAEAVDLLRAMRGSLGEGAFLLIGMDRVKDERLLVAAYDDADGVTARFNLNLLARINRELAGTIPVDAFRHEARWNADAARIEMHLMATRDATFAVAGERFAIGAGETIHTENSHKYTPESARLLLRAGGWTPVREWTDADALFAVVLAQARAVAAAP